MLFLFFSNQRELSELFVSTVISFAVCVALVGGGATCGYNCGEHQRTLALGARQQERDIEKRGGVGEEIFRCNLELKLKSESSLALALKAATGNGTRRTLFMELPCLFCCERINDARCSGLCVWYLAFAFLHTSYMPRG